jgi:hypothetical protein
MSSQKNTKKTPEDALTFLKIDISYYKMKIKYEDIYPIQTNK